MITQNTTLFNISQEKSFRYDFTYLKFNQEYTKNYIPFNELFSIEDSSSNLEHDLNSDFYYCEIGNADKEGDISPVLLNFDNRCLEDENYYKKIEKGDIISVDNDDILISKVRPNLKKFVRITNDKKDIFFTKAFIRIKAKEMPSILYYCLRTIFFDGLMAVTRQGKGYPTINEKDLNTLKFDEDIINKLRAKSDCIKAIIEDVESKVTEQVVKLIPTQKIIDLVFQEEFGFDYGKFEKLKTNRYNTIKQSVFSNNRDLRFSVKYHRPAGKFVLEELAKNTEKRIKHFISEPIALGSSISPSDFDENGEAYYISMATIKTLDIVLDETQLVSKDYYEAKVTKRIQKNDIIMARSGVAIGKTAIVNDDFAGVFADFTMRIRFNRTQYNPQFAYYYLRSKYVQYLIEVHKKGLQNQNIFPIVVQDFPIPDLSLNEQQRIVDKIQNQIKAQDDIKSCVLGLRQKIENAILEAVSA